MHTKESEFPDGTMEDHRADGTVTARGRTARKRRRKVKSATCTASLSHQPQYVRLRKFLHQRGFNPTLLQPAHFSDTGRGLQALRAIKPDEVIISVPESCLLTTSTVLDSELGWHIKRWKPRLSPLEALCVFLVCERHRGEASDWFPYIDLLPRAYTCPAYFSDEVMSVLPVGLRGRALEQRAAVRHMHSSNRDFFKSLTPLLRCPAEDVLTYEAFRWAWCSVNTRSVFMKHPPNHFLSGEDHYALAPFLDLLNHQPTVQVDRPPACVCVGGVATFSSCSPQVKAGFNHESGRYDIRSVSGTARYRQVFISYGSHDNQRLLLEYGFVAAPNPHGVVDVDADLLRDVLMRDKSLDQKMAFLRENSFLQNLTLSSDGPGWRLMTALRLMSLPQTFYHQWKAVLLGQAVCEEREEWSLQTAKTLCLRLQQDTHAALDETRRLLTRCGPSVGEQLHVLLALREEERCIVGSCLEALEELISGRRGAVS